MVQPRVQDTEFTLDDGIARLYEELYGGQAALETASLANLDDLKTEVQYKLRDLFSTEPRIVEHFNRLMKMMCFLYTVPTADVKDKPEYMHEKWYGAFVKLDALLQLDKSVAGLGEEASAKTEVEDLLVSIYSAEKKGLIEIKYVLAVRHPTDRRDMRTDDRDHPDNFLGTFLDRHCWNKWVCQLTVKVLFSIVNLDLLGIFGMSSCSSSSWRCNNSY